jgi:hypothetical protein
MSVLVRVYAISPNNLNITFRRIVVLHSHDDEAAITGAKQYNPDDFKPRSFRVNGKGLNEYVSACDAHFKDHPIESGASVIETLSCKATADLFLETARLFDLEVEAL